MSDYRVWMDRRAFLPNKAVAGVLFTVCLAALLPGQEKGDIASRPGAVPEEKKVELSALLPVPASIGFKVKGQAQFYSSDLSKYLDRRAEAYLQYGLVAMIHQEYTSRTMEVTLDVYDMVIPLNAFGIYSAELSPDSHFVGIGAEGYSGDGLLNFVQREYYVKISASGQKTSAAPMLKTLAEYVSKKIWTGPSLPPEIAAFPSRGLVAHSQKYLVKSPMGHDFLAPAATADYRFDGKGTTLLVSIAGDPAGANARMERLQKTFAKSGGATAIAGPETGAWRGTNQREGEMIFFAHRRYLVVVMHPPASPQAFLREVVAGIDK